MVRCPSVRRTIAADGYVPGAEITSTGRHEAGVAADTRVTNQFRKLGCVIGEERRQGDHDAASNGRAALQLEAIDGRAIGDMF